MMGTMWSFITGFIASELGEIETNRRYKLTDAKKRKIAQPYPSVALATGSYPNLQQFLASGISAPTDDDFSQCRSSFDRPRIPPSNSDRFNGDCRI